MSAEWRRALRSGAVDRLVIEPSFPCHLRARSWVAFQPFREGQMPRSTLRLRWLAPFAIASSIGLVACTTPAGATAAPLTPSPAASEMMESSPSPAGSGMMEESPRPAASGMMEESPSP